MHEQEAAAGPVGSGAKRLVVLSWAACGAEVAVACPDGVPGASLRSPILLMRRYAPGEEPLYGNLHLAVTERYRVVRMLCRDTEPELLG